LCTTTAKLQNPHESGLAGLAESHGRVRLEGTMIEILVVLGCVLGCFIVVAAPVPPSEAIDPRGARASATRRAELRVAGTVLAVTAFACASLMAVSVGAPQLVLPLLVALLLINLVLHPWFLVRFVCIPFGLPLLAYRLSRLGGHPWERDPEGGACLAGALACLHRRHAHRSAAATLLEHLVRPPSSPLRGAGIVAAGLLAADAGNLLRARRLLESLDVLDPDACPPRARDIARSWLIADAAGQGHWSLVIDLCNCAPDPCATTRFFAVVASRLVGEPTSVTALLSAWARAPRRLRTSSVLRLALRSGRNELGLTQTQSRSPDGSDSLAANEGVLPHQRAVAMHLEAAVTPPSSGESLVRVARGWDATLWEPSFRGHLRRRIRALGGRRSPERTAFTVRRDVALDLAGWWNDSDSKLWCGPGDTLEVAREIMIRQLSHALAAAIATLARCSAESALTIWQAWLELRDCHATLIGVCGPARLRAFYGALDHVVAGLVVQLHSTRGQRSLAHGISLWLVQEAERVHDAGAAAHHRVAVVLGP
jgi:hypothetical protein